MISEQEVNDLIEQMAIAGYEREVEGNDWHKDLHPNSIQRAMWREIAKTMLRAVRFPQYLYQACYQLQVVKP